MAVGTLMRWAGAPAQPDEPLEARRSRNIISGAFLGCGVLVTALALFAVPGLSLNHTTVLVILTSVVSVGAIAQIVMAGSIPVVMNHATTASSGVALAVVQILVGDPLAFAAVGLVYVWVAVIAAMYYDRPATITHLCALVLAQVVAAVWAGQPALIPFVVVSAGTCVVVAGLVTLLMQHVRQQMMTDPLTGLVNRRGLAQRFSTTMASLGRDGGPLHIAALDLDKFKELNDTHGHAAGDAMLVRAGRIWRGELRPSDTLARIGGDEFMVLLPGCAPDRAGRAIERLIDAGPAGVECSAGVTRCVRDDTLDTAAARADAAMYRAKQRTGNAVVIDGDPTTTANPDHQ